nr:16S rRNA (guanine(527)-N(7))-methyltransferase RsmG [Mesorhizobium xinjiangense]
MRLKQFEALFGKWARRINLAAPSTLGAVWRRHIADSAQLLRLAPDAAADWIDLGSGGGFPGIVMAILLHGRPGSRVRLVESNQKKAAFLRNALAELGLAGARVDARRVEDVVAATPPPQIVTARALASLETLLDMTWPWIDAGSRALFHKGRDYAAEIELIGDTRNLHLVQHRSIIDDDSVILDIRKLKHHDDSSSSGRLGKRASDE